MARRENAHLWLAEPLMQEPSFLENPMFGCEACYLNGLLVLVLADSDEPWNGLLVPTEHSNHSALLTEFPSLVSHPVLPKWLYLSAELDNFEPVAQKIVRAIAMGDPRIGVTPSVRKRSKRKARSKKRAQPRSTRKN